jgi:ATP-binding cassette subfamily B protein
MIFFANLKRFFSKISHRRKWQLAGISGLMLVGAVAEMVSLGAVFPFLGVLSGKQQVRVVKGGCFYS